MATMDTAKLQEQAIKHLWLHFTQMAGYDPDKHPVMVRGEDIFLYDSNGNKYMDFLSGLFTVQIGYSHGEEIGRAMLEQAMELLAHGLHGVAPRLRRHDHGLAACLCHRIGLRGTVIEAGSQLRDGRRRSIVLEQLQAVQAQLRHAMVPVERLTGIVEDP